MRTILALLVVVFIAFFYTSCNDEGSVINTPGNETGGILQTFTGSVTGYVDAPWGDGDYTRIFEGSGNSNLTGDCSALLEYVITSYNPTNQSGTTGFGKGTLTQKNSNLKIYIINAGGNFQFYGDSMAYTLNGDLAGGTGKFKGIRGSIQYYGYMKASTRWGIGSWNAAFTMEKPFDGKIDGMIYPTTWNCGTGTFGRTGDGTGPIVEIGNLSAHFEFCSKYLAAPPNAEGILIPKGTFKNILTSDSGDEVWVYLTGGTFKVIGSEVYKGKTYLKVAATMYANINGGTGMYANANGKAHAGGFQYMDLENPLTSPTISLTQWYGGWTY